MVEEVFYLILAAVAFILGVFSYRLKVARLLRAFKELLREFSDDAEALARYMEWPSWDNAVKLLREIRDDIPVLARIIEEFKGEAER